MAKGKSIYRRLTGRKRTLGGFTQLWLAPDHILLVKSTRFIEYYQRFSLADIQAIVVTELPKNWMLQRAAIAGIILTGVGFFAVTSIFAKVLIAIFGIAALGALFSDIALGARCDCHLYTEVSRELLQPVSRWSTARDFLQRIRPAIEAVQGSLTAERAAALEVPVDSFEKPPEVPNAPGYLPEALFILFLVDAAIVLGSIRFPQAQLTSVLFTTVFGEIVILVVALLRRAGRDSRRFIYALMIASIFCISWDGFHLVGSFAGWMNGVVDSAKRGNSTPPSILTWIAFSQSAALFAAIWRIAAGTIGLAAAWFERGFERGFERQ